MVGGGLRSSPGVPQATSRPLRSGRGRTEPGAAATAQPTGAAQPSGAPARRPLESQCPAQGPQRAAAPPRIRARPPDYPEGGAVQAAGARGRPRRLPERNAVARRAPARTRPVSGRLALLPPALVAGALRSGPCLRGRRGRALGAALARGALLRLGAGVRYLLLLQLVLLCPDGVPLGQRPLDLVEVLEPELRRLLLLERLQLRHLGLVLLHELLDFLGRERRDRHSDQVLEVFDAFGRRRARGAATARAAFARLLVATVASALLSILVVTLCVLAVVGFLLAQGQPLHLVHWLKAAAPDVLDEVVDLPLLDDQLPRDHQLDEPGLCAQYLTLAHELADLMRLPLFVHGQAQRGKV
mmetsp:Transcript_40456/g.107209  ORF Transcript_40456/g.107209 Transcript_40456/m.107209 type:complete len:356 (+) Transcript_40456:20-1087(+)